MHVNRPKPSEDVEDLEREQERFLSSQSRASVTLQKRHVQDGPETGRAEPRRKSRFRHERDEARSQLPSTTDTSMMMAPLLNELVERPGTAVYIPEVPRLEATLESFPKPARRDIPFTTVSKGQAAPKQSLFMQSLGSLAGPAVVQGLQTREEIDKEYDAIEKENQEKLAKMTPEEIIEAQRELLARLDPKVVKFLRDRKARPRTNVAQIIKGGSQLDDAALSGLLSLTPAPANPPSTAEFREGELPLHPSTMAQYPGMQRVEKDKLAWMTLLPSLANTKTQSDGSNDNERPGKAIFQCRFDFEGRILSANLDVPTQHALHHHGEEPERAGYTVQELMALLASTVPSQRIVSLQVLANILNNHHSGKYDRCFPSGPDLLENLLSSGLVSLLRVALDDQAASQVSEALKTVYALLVSPHDETCLDLIYSWVDEEPYMRPALEIFNSQGPSAEEFREFTDEQLLSCDIVWGLLRMGILARIRYLLEVCQPDAGAIGAALGSLTRIARHSPEAAERVATCPRLCNFIVAEYLPLFGWNTPRLLHGKLASSGGIPLAQALRLMRILCASSRSVAASLLVDHSLERTIGIYLNIDVNDGRLPRREVLQLQLESLRLLRVFLRHGLCGDLFDNLSPIVLRQLNFAQQISLRPKQGDPQLFDLDYAANLVACTHARFKQMISQDEGDNEWQAVASHIRAITAAAVRWTNELVEESSVRITAMSTLAVALRFLADAHFHRSNEVELNSVLKAFQRLADGTRWSSLLEAMKTSSVFTADFAETSVNMYGSKRDIAALPSLSAIQFGTETVIATVNERSPLFLLDSIIYFVWSGVQSGALSGIEDVGWRLLSCGPLATYLSRVNAVSFGGSVGSPWFARNEVSFLYRLVRLRVALESYAKSKNGAQNVLEMDLFYETALTILPLLSPDRSASINHLLNRVIFNRSCYSDMPVADVANLSVARQTPVSASGQPVYGDRELLHQALEEIADVLRTAEDMIYFVRGTINAKF
ncbi:RNA polymerase II-associated protein 1-like, partial [Tropilaelaps mercedesae]